MAGKKKQPTKMPREKLPQPANAPAPENPAGKNRSEDQAGGPEHSGGDARDDRNP